MTLGTVTIKVDEELRKKMRSVSINWSDYIRNAIRRRVDMEERRRAAERLLEDLRAGKHVVPKGFIDQSIREMRKAR